MLHSSTATHQPGNTAGYHPPGGVDSKSPGYGFQSSVQIKDYPRPLAGDEVLTEGEIRRRVDQAIEHAVARKDSAFVTGVVLFAETAKLVSDTSAKFTFEDPARLSAFAAWLRANYADVTRELTLQMHCSPSTPATHVVAASLRFAQALEIQPEKLESTLYGSGPDSPRTPTALLTVRGRGICCVLARMSQRLRQLAEAHGRKQPELAKERKGVILARFLDSLLNACGWEAYPPSSFADVSQAGVADSSPQQSQPPAAPSPQVQPEPMHLDPAVLPKLSRRIELMFAAAGEEEQPMEDFIQEELRRLAKKGDALGVAACACGLWQLRARLAASKPLTTFRMGDQPGSSASQGSAGKRRSGEHQAPTPQLPPYVSVKQFAALICYSEGYVREKLLRTVFVKDVHYMQRPGGKRILIDREKAMAAFAKHVETQQ